MNSILSLGKYLFAIPFAVFGVMHFMNAGAMAGLTPFGGVIMVYLTGAALLAAAISIIIGKMDKLAATLLGVFLILTALLVHAAALSGEADPNAMSNLLKDLALAGGAWVYAAYAAKDNSVMN